MMMGRILDFGDQNRAKTLQEGHALPEGRFLTVPQLHQCLQEVPLQMSSKEVEVLATGKTA
jgi:hypothetical protein